MIKLRLRSGDEMGHRLFNPLGFLLAIVVLYGGELLIPRILFCAKLFRVVPTC